MKTNQATTQTPAELLTQLQALVLEAETMISDANAERCDGPLANQRERFGAAQERLTDLCAAAKNKVVAGAKSTDTAIRQNPYQSLAVALGVGLVAGVLIGRRNR